MLREGMVDFPGIATLQTVSVGDAFVRFVAAVLFGGALGYNRERLGKPAGLRTHIMVALGACTFLLLGMELLAEVSSSHGTPLDPTRVLQGVVGGIGFLGAGSIIQRKGDVEGITTAATVWVAGAVGAGCGMGQLALVAILVFFSVASLWTLGNFGHKRPRTDEPGGTDKPGAGEPVDQESREGMG